MNNPAAKAFGLKIILNQGSNHAIILCLQLVASIFIARNLGPQGLGELAIIQAVLLLFKPLTELGTRNYLTREIVNSQNINTKINWVKAADSLSKKCTLLSLGLLSIVTLVAYILKTTYPENVVNNLFDPSLWMVCFLIVMLGSYCETKGQSQLMLLQNINRVLKRNLYINITCAFFKVLAAITILSKELLIIVYFLTVALEYLLKAIDNNYYLKKLPINTLNPNSLGAGVTLRKKQALLFKESLKYLPNELTINAESQVPKIWLSSQGNEVLGNFSVAQKHGIVIKTLNKLSHDNDMENPKMMVALKYATLGAVLSAITVPLIPYVYGADFTSATYYAYLLIIPGFLSVIGSKLLAKLIAHNQTSIASRVNILGFITLLVFCSLLIPSYGVAGVAIALSMGWLTQICLGLALFREHKIKETFPLNNSPK